MVYMVQLCNLFFPNKLKVLLLARIARCEVSVHSAMFSFVIDQHGCHLVYEMITHL